MNITIHKNKIISFRMGLTLASLFAASLNLFSLHFYFIFLAFLLFAIKPERKFRGDVSVVLLFILAITWGFFSPTVDGSLLGIVKAFTYVLCYIMGMGFLDDRAEKDNVKSPYKLFYLVVVVLALGMLSHYLLNWSINLNTVKRETIDIWTGTVMAATGQAALACLSLGVAISFLFTKQNKLVKIASVVVIVVILLYNFILAGRTLFLMLILTALAAFLHKLSAQKKGKMRAIVIVLAIVLVLVFAYQANVFNVKNYVESTPLYDRFFSDENSKEIDDDARMERKIYFMTHMDKSVFGGAHLREEVGYAHDIFLDTYDEAGIIAFIAIVVYMFLSVKRLILCVKNKALPFSFKNMIVCIYVTMFIEFMIEPILLGSQWLFAAFCLIDGYLGRVLRYSKINNSQQR